MEYRIRNRRVALDRVTWVAGPVEGPLVAQCSAHGAPRAARVEGDDVVFVRPERRVAAGQSVVLYAGDEVVGSGMVV